jgi:L-threonylcarbamoyladenylate synthase
VDDLLILDGGACQVGIESTVVDATGESAVILRLGDVSEMDIAEVVAVAATADVSGAGPVRSPGQAFRHYAPHCPLDILPSGVQPDPDAMSDPDVWTFWIGDNPPVGERVVPLGEQPKVVATKLYAGLHQADGAGAKRIVIAGLPLGAEWAAVADRLRRAAVTKP